MKKLYIVIAIILALALLIPMALPVAAANPNKPVAWASWGASNGPVKETYPSGHEQASIEVKQLADGSTTGFINTKSLTAHTATSWNVLNSAFPPADGVKEADILAQVPGVPAYFWWLLRDVDETGVGNDTF
jgi:hypothetical protein